jgi:DNA-binding NtrC family response regulator
MDVRLVAATHRDLPKLVLEGRFREDLWYRLNVASIHLPPLRERREDIRELVPHFLERIAREHGLESIDIAESAAERLAEHDWPGNVRELAHALERAAIDAAGERIEITHLAPSVSAPRDSLARTPAPGDSGARTARPFVLEVEDLSLASVERSLIERVLVETNGNRTLAARRLGMHRATLHGKLRASSSARRAG